MGMETLEQPLQKHAMIWRARSKYTLKIKFTFIYVWPQGGAIFWLD